MQTVRHIPPVPPPEMRRAGQAPSPGERLEAAFLEEMLKYMGPQARQGEQSGGAGEAQFHSFLSREYARILAGRLDLRIGKVGP